MIRRTFVDSISGTWERVTRQEAKEAYNDGKTVMLCPVNMRPFTPWRIEEYVNKNYKDCKDVPFEKVVILFEHYNCGDYKTGKYAAYYVEVE